MKTILFFACFFLMTSFVVAGDYHHHDYTVVNETTVVTKYTGTSLGMAASSCNFKTASASLQGCLGVADYDGSQSGVIGLGFRTSAGKNPILLNIKFGREHGENGLSGGVNWNF